MKRKEKRIQTTEDWYPTSNGTVRVICCDLSNGLRRVAVWGGDDFGLEIDTLDLNLALELYEKIKDFTTQKELIAMGFYNA
jgi:hypothetical protein